MNVDPPVEDFDPTTAELLALFAQEAEVNSKVYREAATNSDWNMSMDAGTLSVSQFCNITYTALGLAGEAGELAGEVKKIMRNDHGRLTDERRAKIRDEAGDVLWYLIRLLDEAGLSLREVMLANIYKLRERRAAGTLAERAK